MSCPTIVTFSSASLPSTSWTTAAIASVDPSVASPVDPPMPGRSNATARYPPEAAWRITARQASEDCGHPCRKTIAGPSSKPASMTWMELSLTAIAESRNATRQPVAVLPSCDVVVIRHTPSRH